MSHYTTLRYTTPTTTTTTTTILHLHYTPLHYTTPHYTTPHHTTLNYTTLHYTTLPYPTFLYITLHCITLHYITLHSLHHHTCNCNYTTLITLHPQLQLHYATTTTTAALHHTSSCGWGGRPRDHCNHCSHSKKTQLQPPFGPSVDLLCHPWFTTTNLSYRFPIFETSATALCGTTGQKMSQNLTDLDAKMDLIFYWLMWDWKIIIQSKLVFYFHRYK